VGRKEKRRDARRVNYSSLRGTKRREHFFLTPAVFEERKKNMCRAILSAHNLLSGWKEINLFFARLRKKKKGGGKENRISLAAYGNGGGGGKSCFLRARGEEKKKERGWGDLLFRAAREGKEKVQGDEYGGVNHDEKKKEQSCSISIP